MPQWDMVRCVIDWFIRTPIRVEKIHFNNSNWAHVRWTNPFARLISDTIKSKRCSPGVSENFAHFREIMLEQTLRHGYYPIFTFQDSKNMTHGFVRKGQIGPPFSPPYNGPSKVIEKHEKYLVVFFDNKNIAISIERLKPVYTKRNDVPANQNERLNPLAERHLSSKETSSILPLTTNQFLYFHFFFLFLIFCFSRFENFLLHLTIWNHCKYFILVLYFLSVRE